MRRIRKRVVVWMTFHGGLKIALSAWLALMVVFILTYELPATKTWTYWTMPLSGKVIALDAGHGGADGGAESKDGLVEKNINLGITLYLRDYLQQVGAVVIMTREEDKDLANVNTKGYSRRKAEDLKQRVQYVNQYKSDLFVSVHLNSIPSSRYSGAQTFYSVSHSDNVILATLIQNELKRNLLNTERIAKSITTLYLLKNLKMPSALVEVGFLSNPEEANLMADPSYQMRVAASIYQGILRYYSGEKVGSL
jgi:N-acetylmuramoyl-L-alanine amidase